VDVEIVEKKGLCWLYGDGGNMVHRSFGGRRRIGLVPSQYERVPRKALLRINSGGCAGRRM
jgi:hypothetical protein